MLSNLRKEIKDFKETSHLEVKEEDVLVVYQYVLAKKAFLKDKEAPYEPVLSFNPTRIELKPSKEYQEKLDKTDKLKNIDRVYHNDYILDAYLNDFEAFNEERGISFKRSEKLY
ncbi:MAG: hypothetical protein ACOX02_03810 [Acholeplasmatales bacterium]